MQKKHKCSLMAAISLDGKISDNPKFMPDWTSKEDWELFQKILSECDLIVAGRNTYEAAKKHLQKRNAIILSSRNYESKLANIRFVNPKKCDIKEIIARYRNVVIVGGAGVYNLALREEWCTDLYLTIEPVFLGSGISLCGDEVFNRNEVRLGNQKRLNKKGTVLLHYKV